MLKFVRRLFRRIDAVCFAAPSGFRHSAWRFSLVFSKWVSSGDAPS